mmetsp:Transcript_34529/g.87962  ORF Transcript_34529/g.87962 Transcript_34529/m.87962 type:complete len:201 (-) Transcript_34529:827-1429(-)
MVPERSSRPARIPQLVLQRELLVGGVRASRHQPAEVLVHGRIVVADEDAVCDVRCERLPSEGRHGCRDRGHRPLDLGVQQVLLLKRAERELREGLALVRGNTPVGARLVGEAARGEAGQRHDAPRCREAHSELVLALVDGAGDRLKGRLRLLRAHEGHRHDHTVDQIQHRVDGLLGGAAVPELGHIRLGFGSGSPTTNHR